MKQMLIWTAVAAVGTVAFFIMKTKTNRSQVLSPEQTPEPQDKVLSKPRTHIPGIHANKYK